MNHLQVASLPTEDVFCFPATFAQEQLWLLHELLPDSHLYNMACAFTLSGALNAAALTQSLSTIVKRHEILRTTFAVINEELVQQIHPTSTHSCLSLVSLAHYPPSGRQAQAERRLRAEAFRPFDLTIGPLFRVTLYQLDPTHSFLLLALHHIIADGPSLSLLCHELSVLYTAITSERAADLPVLSIQVADYAHWQQEQAAALGSELVYWRKKLAGPGPQQTVPTDYPRPPHPTFAGQRHRFQLTSTLTQGLQALAHQNNASLFMLTLAAFQLLLHRYTGQTDIRVGTPFSGRNRSELIPLIGYFVNTIVLRTDLSGKPTFRQLLARVRQVALEAFAHPNLPFTKLVSALQPERQSGHSPLFQVMFVFEHESEPLPDLPGIEVSSFPLDNDLAKFDLTLELRQTEEGLCGLFEYNSDLFAPDSITRMADHLEQLLASIVAAPDSPISRLSLLTSDEYQEMLALARPRPTRPLPSLAPLHTLFEAQVDRDPHQVALFFEGTTWSYQELNQQANRLAHYLRQLDVKPGTRVGICLDRSPEMVVAILAVLKAGCAYVPLDPAYPQARRHFILEDAAAVVLISQHEFVARWPHTCPTCCLDTDAPLIAHCPETNLNLNLSLETPAYLIYTSGSTGQPKGVVVPHRGIANRILWGIAYHRLTPADRLLQKTTFSFDVSLWEFFGALVSGATLVLARPGGQQDPRYLVQIMAEQAITQVDFVPAMLALVLEEPDLSQCTALRLITVGGEALPLAVCQEFFTRLPHVELHNCYGPTEVSIDATSWTVSPEARVISIGQPIANQELYLLDTHLQPVPLGVPGELYVGGVGLAHGYHNRPELTAARFIPHPFSQQPGARLYHTGDLGRRLPGGEMEFLGRVDDQVKVRGFRIELDDVVHHLNQHPAIREAAAIVNEVTGELAAYVSTAPQPEFWPSVGEYPLYDDLTYYAMTHDEERNRYYRLAIAELVQDKLVVEIGTGKDAILARACVMAGARKVYAIESAAEAFRQATELVTRLGLQDKISLIHGYSTDITLPEAVDVCVSEIIGTIGGSEGAAALLNDARRFLKPGGRIIPDRCLTRIAAASLPPSLRHNPGFSQTSAHYVQQVLDHVGPTFTPRLCVKNVSPFLLSDDADFEVLDFNQTTPSSYHHSIRLIIRQAGQLDGFLLWINLHTAPGLVIDSLLQATSWLPVYFPAFAPGLMVTPGDIIEATCTSRLSDNDVNPDYALQGQLLRQDGSAMAFAVSSPHHQPLTSRHPLYDALFPAGVIKTLPSITAAILHDFLVEHLPDYMIPTSITFVEALPRTPAGKLDRQTLLSVAGSEPVQTASSTPRTPTEETITGLWVELLPREPIGREDNFFHLGGHSLLCTRLVARLRHLFQMEIALADVFAHPTLAGLAAYVDGQVRDGLKLTLPPIEPVSSQASWPQAFAQQRLWFLDQLEPGQPTYNMPYAIRMRGHLDKDALSRSLETIVARHDVLRTTFTTGGQPHQFIASIENCPMTLAEVSLDYLSSETRDAAARIWMNAAARQPFNLAEGPLFRFTLLSLDEADHLLFLNLHHIIFDGWSFTVFYEELGQLYRAYLAGTENPLPALPIQYRDFACWQRAWLQGETVARQLTYWRTQLAGAPTLLELPTDRPRPIIQTFNGNTQTVILSSSLADSLQILGRQQGATLFMTLFTAFNLLLHRYTGQTDILVGTPIAGRTQAETEGLLGFFVNTLVLRTDLSGNPSFPQLLERVRQMALTAYTHQDLPFEQLVEALQPARDLSYPPLFQVMFALQNTPLADLDLPGVTASTFYVPSGTAKFDLNASLTNTLDGLVINLEYNRDLFEEGTINRLLGQYETLLRGILRDPDQPISHLPILTAMEQTLLRQWNSQTVEYEHTPIHHLFERQAEQTPAELAAVHQGSSLTYRQLNQQANQLAHALRAQGIGPDDRVALCLPRSLEMVIAVLGVLKAGAAYVPLDPSYPPARLSFMLNDSQARLLLTLPDVLGDGPHAVPVVHLNETFWQGQANTNPTPLATAEHLLYVIYTSGSTGQPKGVALPHRALANLLAWQKETIPGRGRTLQFAPLSFDVSCQEMFSTWQVGGTLFLVDEEVRRDPLQLLAFLDEARIERLFLPFVALQHLAETAVQADRVLPQLHHVITAGEQLHITPAIRTWFQHLPACRLHNQYGPSETHVVTAYTLPPNPDEWLVLPPIGSPLPNTQIYILDNQQQLVPLGVPGELWIGGVHLARGYLNQPALTQERFIEWGQDKVSLEPLRSGDGARLSVESQPDEGDSASACLRQAPSLGQADVVADRRGILYRTGDLARWQADGTIAYLGRVDQQVKVRGFRIEPGEIETVLVQHEAIAEAVVVARTLTSTGESTSSAAKQLVAYLVAAASLQENQVRVYLQERLPAYMLPSRFVFLDRLPLTPSGKVDRRALPAPEALRPDLASPFLSPRTELEHQIAAVWQELLHLERVGLADNFFDLGGHSLLMAQVHSRLREFLDQPPSMLDLFKYPTIQALAAYLSQIALSAPLPPLAVRPNERLSQRVQHYRQQSRLIHGKH